MAGVTIDLGTGRPVTLQRADAAGSGQQSRGQQRYAAEFLRRWPRSKADAYRALEHIKQLGLHTLPSFSFAGHDWVAALKRAVQRGQVLVTVESVSVASGGAAGQAARGGPAGVRPYPLAGREMVAAGVAEPGSYLDSVGSSARVFDDYSDVSAGDLIAYLQSVVAGVGAAGSADELASDSPDADASTPLGDAQPFELGGDQPMGDSTSLAARATDEWKEADCYAQYERELELCGALGKPMGGSSGYAICKQNAFDRYQECRGY